MSVSAITSLNPKVKNIDPKHGKYAVNYSFRWAGLTPDITVSVPGFVEAGGSSILGNGIADLFSPLLRANGSAGIPPIKWVMGTVILLPLEVPATTSPDFYSGGLYLVSPDTGQVIALTQKQNAYQVHGSGAPPNIEFVTGEVDPGAITFSLPFDTIAEQSNIQVIKLADTSVGNAAQMSGFANISFLTYESQPYLR